MRGISPSGSRPRGISPRRDFTRDEPRSWFVHIFTFYIERILTRMDSRILQGSIRPTSKAESPAASSIHKQQGTDNNQAANHRQPDNRL